MSESKKPLTYEQKPEAIVKEANVLSREALQALYAIGAIETVHIVTNCTGFYFAAEFGKGPWTDQNMPPGNYLVVKIVEKPSANAGLYGVKAPKAE
jgi:hypothetical protein